MIEQVRPSELDAWLEQAAAGGAAPLVLDVRESWELEIASVKPQGFELLAIPMSEMPGALAAVDSNRPIACLCHHGGRSQRVASYLEQQGFAKLANIAGGIDVWSQERDPSVPRY